MDKCRCHYDGFKCKVLAEKDTEIARLKADRAAWEQNWAESQNEVRRLRKALEHYATPGIHERWIAEEALKGGNHEP